MGFQGPRLSVVSPYWDHDLAALRDLMGRWGNPITTVLLDVGVHDFPSNAKMPSGLEILDVSKWKEGRFKHAKMLIAQTAEHDHILTGSANCTIPALGWRGNAGSNAEA